MSVLRAFRGSLLVVFSYIIEPLAKFGRFDMGLGLAPLRQRPFPEVEIDRADAVLDAAPQHPADIRHTVVQPHARHLTGTGLAEVGRAELLELIGREIVLVADIPQLEAGIVVAAIFI